MTDHPTDATPPEGFADLPMQPTGSGVADLETAYERMKLAEGDEGVPTDAPVDPVMESEAHPS